MLVENFNYLTAHNPVMTRDTYLPRSLSLSLSLSPFSSLITFLLLNPNKHPCRALASARKLACRSAVLSQARECFRIRNGEQRYRVKPRARSREDDFPRRYRTGHFCADLTCRRGSLILLVNLKDCSWAIFPPGLLVMSARRVGPASFPLPLSCRVAFNRFPFSLLPDLSAGVGQIRRV